MFKSARWSSEKNRIKAVFELQFQATQVPRLKGKKKLMISLVPESVGKTGKISRSADLRYREDLLFPGQLIDDAGNVKVGRDLHKAIKPSKLQQLKEIFPDKKFLLNRGTKWTDMVLEHNATGEDATRGWLVAAYAANFGKSAHEPNFNALQEAFGRMNSVIFPFISELQAEGWHTDRFLDGKGSWFAF